MVTGLLLFGSGCGWAAVMATILLTGRVFEVVDPTWVLVLELILSLILGLAGLVKYCLDLIKWSRGLDLGPTKAVKEKKGRKTSN